MLKKTKLRLGVVAATAVMAVAFSATAPAYADPSGFKPINGVGSDTTQDIVGGLAAVISNLGSYDATGGGNIKTTASGNSFPRPVGSGAGQIALSDSINPDAGGVAGAGNHLFNSVDITNQVDFARSSSGPNSSLPGTALTFIPFARDAVTFAVSAASDFPRDIPLGYANGVATTNTGFTLRNIYRGIRTTYLDADFNSVTIRPLLPQTGSGTRSFWIGQLGLTDDSSSLGSNVTDIGNTVIEHDGTFVTQPGDIVPFSVAQYIAQGNHGALPTTVNERRGNIQLGNIGTVKPYLPKAGGGITLNTSFPVNRLVYNVVSTARLSGTSAADLALQAMFVGSGSSVCSASSTIAAYGFGVLGTTGTSACGDTSRTQNYKFS